MGWAKRLPVLEYILEVPLRSFRPANIARSMWVFAYSQKCPLRRYRGIYAVSPILGQIIPACFQFYPSDKNNERSQKRLKRWQGFHLLSDVFRWPKVKQPYMNKPVCIALLVAGVILTVLGVNATNSFSSDVSRFFTGSPTDKAVWMLVGGIVIGIVGLFGLSLGSRRT